MSDITQIQVGTTTYTIADEIANNNINTLSTSLYSLTTSLSSMAYQSDVPSDNKQYIRKNGNWEEISISNSTNWNDIINKPSNFPPSTHTHDDRYYTESETDTLIGAKADTSSLGDLAYEDSVDYSDVTNTPTLGTMAAVNDAPSDGSKYIRKNGTWEEVTGSCGASTLHISMASTSSLGTINNASIMTTMRVVNIVWGTPRNVTSNVTWNTNTAGQLVLSGTLSGATTAEIDLVDFGPDGEIITSGTIPMPSASQSDSGWQSITHSNISGTLYYRKIGNIVELYGNSIGLSSSVGTSGLTIGSLPDGFRPSENRATPAGGTSDWGFLLINSTGNIVFYKHPSQSSWSGNINFSITFMVG